MRALCGRMPEGILPADRKMGKAVTGLQSRPVTAHGVINTFIMGHDQGLQESEVTMEELGSEDLATCDINYEIVYVGEGKLYQRCLRELMSDNFFWFSSFGSNDTTDGNWREADNPTKAKKVYGKTYNYGFTDDWILCYPDRIVKVVPYFDDELTDEDLKIIDEKLGSRGITGCRSGYIEAGDNI